MSEETLMTTTSFKTEPGYYAPKRYQMTCYLKPKTIPVWYTTTIVMKINSTAKKYTEKAYFERKLVPFYYSESMKTLTAATKPPQFVATLEIPRDVPDEHWISLEHQQSLDCNKCVQSLFVNDSTALAC